MATLFLLTCTVILMNALYTQKMCCLAAECTPVNYVRFRDRIAEGVTTPVQVGHPGRFLADTYVFGCNGVITQWQAYTFNNGPHPIEFHVWREDETTENVFHLVGMNSFQNAQPDANHLISFDIPSDQQITVAPGDIAGIRTVEAVNATEEEGFRIQFDDGGMYRQYYRGRFPPNSDETIPTPSTLELRPSVSGAFATLMFGSGRSPIMRATVSEFSNASTAGSVTSTTVPPPTSVILSPSTIIAIAVSGGVLFITTIIVIITLLSCCIFYKRTKKLAGDQNQTQRVNPNLQQNTYPLENNPSYNAGHSDARLVNNQTYRNSDYPQLVNNQAYNRNDLHDNTQLTNNPSYNYDQAGYVNDPYYTVIRT